MRIVTRRQLRAARKRLGFSVAKAAASVHITPRSWVRYESGETPVPETIAHLFCLVNGISFRPKTRKSRT